MNVGLQSLVALTKDLLAITLPLALIWALASIRLGDRSAPWARCGVLAGIAGAIAMAVLGRMTAIFEREIYELWVLVVAAAAESVLLALLARPRDRATSRFPGALLLAVSAAPFLHRGPDVMTDAARPFRVVAVTFNTEFLLVVLGILATLVFALVVGAALRRAAMAASPALLFAVTAASYAVLIAHQALIVTQVSLARGFLPMSPTSIALVAPLINGQDVFLYAQIAVAAVLPVRLLLIRPAPTPQREPGANPAQRRKSRADARSRSRWAGGAVCAALAALLALPALTAYANREARLSPAEPVVPAGGVVSIPLETLEDGHLHRFAFAASDGTEVRFIAIRKNESSFAAALDACQICGKTGYYERGGQVVCKLCDVVMNKATIGFRGGCNPIPLEFRLDPESIAIDALSLENERERFQ